MKKKIITDGIVLIITVLTIFTTALAGESITFIASCSIPVIPGVNTAMIEEETVKRNTDKANTSASEKKDLNIPNETKTQMPTIIQENKGKEMKLMEGKVLPLIIKTLYIR